MIMRKKPIKLKLFRNKLTGYYEIYEVSEEGHFDFVISKAARGEAENLINSLLKDGYYEELL